MENILLIALYCFIFFVAGACIIGLYLIYKELHNINNSLYNIPQSEFILFDDVYINMNNIAEIFKIINIVDHKYFITITSIIGNQHFEYFDSEDECHFRYNELLEQISRFE